VVGAQAANDRKTVRRTAGANRGEVGSSRPGAGTGLQNVRYRFRGDIGRFSSPKKLVGYTGLCPASTSPAAPIAAGRLRTPA